MGVLQGLTEFLPISSTAHLRIVPALLGWGDAGAAFTAVIQLGTLAAVLLYFASDIVSIFKSLFRCALKGNLIAEREALLGWMIAAGTVPIVVFGLLFKDQIETGLRSLYAIAASMILLALILAIAEGVVKRRITSGYVFKGIDRLGWWEVILVGFAQAVALIPGSSRSGTTITGGLFVGMNRETAARFSFLLSLPSVFAAGLFEFYKESGALLSSQIGALNIIVAVLTAGIVGYASIAFLLGYLKRRTTWLFIIYRLLVGVLLLALLWRGVVQPL